MLNRKVCYDCRKKYDRNPKNVGFKYAWNLERVLCFGIEKDRYKLANIKEDPPEWCMYHLEHTVNKYA